MKNNELLSAIEKIMPEIIDIRRDIHKHPEIGRKEFRTTELIKKSLKNMVLTIYFLLCLQVR